MVTTFDIAQLETRFAALPADRQQAEWLGFLDALDLGDVGHHPFSLILGRRWERSEPPSDQVQMKPERRRHAAGEGDHKARDLDAVYGAPAF
jgi:hypothetical protein